MPYLQLDLDAIPEMETAARVAGIPFGDICGGLVKLWEYCWRQKATHVSVTRLESYFPASQRLLMGLELGEFINRPGDRADILVRGAEKRLGIAKARSEGGKKARTNLRQFSGSSPAQAGREPEVEPEGSTGSAPGLTSSIQQPASKDSLNNPLPPSGELGLFEEIPAKPLGEPKAKRKPREKKPEPELEEVAAYYVEAMGDNGLPTELTDRGKGHIRARLKEGRTVAECKDAIAGLCWSKFHRDHGYTDIYYALHSPEQMRMITARLGKHEPDPVVDNVARWEGLSR